jgi:isopenicillin N synthase-like dioxygenase
MCHQNIQFPLGGSILIMILHTLNLQDFISGTEEQRLEFSKKLLDSFESSGFVKLSGHGFDAVKIKKLFGWV